MAAGADILYSQSGTDTRDGATSEPPLSQHGHPHQEGGGDTRSAQELF